MCAMKSEELFFLFCIAAAIVICGCLSTSANPTISTAAQGIATISHDHQNSTGSSQHPVTVDRQGRVIQLSKPAQRIIVTNSDAAKVLMLLGAQDQIVGISDSVKKNPATSVLGDKPSVGDYATPDPEKLAALNPDLVIFYSSDSPRNLDLINQANITYAFFDCYKVDKLNDDIRSVGILTGKQARADEFISFVNSTMDLIKNRTQSIPPAKKQRVYFETGTDYTAAGTDSGGDLIIRSAGGQNIAGDTGVQWPKVSQEWIVAQNPDVIIKNAPSYDSEDNFSATVNEVMERPGFQNISAVRNHRVYAFSGNLLYGPPSVISITYLAKILYPDQLADLDPNQIFNEYSTRFFPGANQQKIVYPDI